MPGAAQSMDKLQADIIEQLIKENNEEYQEREWLAILLITFIVLVSGALIIATIISSVKEAVCAI